MRRFLFPAAVCAAMCIPLSASLKVQAASYAGHWTATLSAACVNSPQNAKVCGFVIGQMAAIGKTGTQLTVSGTDTFTVNAAGKYTDSGTETLSEAAPTSKLKGCPLSKLGAALFTGSCTLTFKGSGHVIMKGGTPVFYTDLVSLYYQGKYEGSEKGAQANTGLPTPAKVGTYGASWAAQQAGASSAPAGFTFRGVISRG